MSTVCLVSITTASDTFDRVAVRFAIVPRIGERIRVPSRHFVYQVEDVVHQGIEPEDAQGQPGVHIKASRIDGAGEGA